MHITVVGAGAVGGYFGGVLANNGDNVTFIARGEHCSAINDNGLKVFSHWGDFQVPVLATPDPSEIGEVDLVLYCVKLYSNPETLPLIAPLVGANTTILTLQNGVTSGEVIAEHYGWDSVLQGATYVESAISEPGVIEQTGSVARIEFGEKNGLETTRTTTIKHLLNKPGIDSAVSKNITFTLWNKLVTVAAIGTIMTAGRANLPEVLSGSEGMNTIRTVMEEIISVGKSEGIEFPPNVVEEKLSGAVDEAEDFKSSLQYDLTVGKPLELDDLLGSVVLMARSAGIPVPASATLTMVLDKFKNGS